MKKNCRFIKAILLFAVFIFTTTVSTTAQIRIKRTVFQGFWWDYWNSNYPNGWANYLTELAPRLKVAGFNAVWIPPVYKNSSTGSVGYSPFDLYDLGDKYQKGGGSLTVRTRVGTKDELLRMIAVLHANGIEVIQDIVLNHHDGAGTNSGAGGQDPHSFSMQNSSGYKNFRYVSYATPGLDESQNDYWTRTGRWSKNFPNFHPTGFHDCTSGDICNALFGPDICYYQQAYGQSSNIPVTGSIKIGDTTRHYFNPAQSDNYMRDKGRDWIKWFKKQTGSDGFRWDAVKHYETDVQQDYTYHSKYSLPDWAKGGEDMFNVAEWVGGKADLDNYVNAVQSNGEKHTGTFDFNLRAYDGSGGLYGMIKGFGGFDMQALPGAQQNERFMDYGSKRVHRTNPFVNNHDTYRPKLQANGDLYPLGDDSGWNTGDELSAHVDPREPRLASAYAVVAAVDGNPAVFFEDLFNVANTGKRFSHLPTSTADLPVNSDVQNILQAHQRLAFKDGEYAVPTHGGNPSYQKGGSGDHLVIERKNRAIIGITDAYSTAANNNDDQEVWVTVDASWIGKILYDYSGAHGTLGTQVFNDGRILIRTAPVGHTITDAFGHGYSIWAPAPNGGTVTSVQQLYDHLTTYEQPLTPVTTQEWEMADDLGDSHCQSLGQGGTLPTNSTNQRVAGKIYTDAGKTITYKVFPEVDGRNLTVSLWDLNGNKLSETQGVATNASPLQGTYNALSTGWVVVKVRNTLGSQAGQKVWVNVSYTAPKEINTRLEASKPETRVAIWTGNKGTKDVLDCGNWEEGKLPNAAVDVVIPAYASPAPVIASDLTVRNLTIESGAQLTISDATLKVSGSITLGGLIDATNATIEMNGITAQVIAANTYLNNTVKSLIINNAAGVTLLGPLVVTDVLTPTAGKLYTNGHLILRSTAAGTARIAAGPASGGYITGAVTVERFVPAKVARKWSFVASPVSSTVRSSWQQQTFVTGPGTGGSPCGTTTGNGTVSLDKYNSNGFDVSQSNTTTLFGYNGAQPSGSRWSGIANTSALLAPGRGYRMNVRGTRGLNDANCQDLLTSATPSAPNAVTLSATGSMTTGVNMGDVTVTLDGTSDDFTLLGNPYPSTIDFSLVSADNSALNNKYWFYSPENTTSSTGTQYSAYNAGVMTNKPASYTDGMSKFIASGQSFFVQKGTASTVTFKESHKAAAQTGSFRTAAWTNLIRAALKNSTGIGHLDEVVIRFSDEQGVDKETLGGLDSKSLNEGGLSLATLKGGEKLAIQTRPLHFIRDTVKLGLVSTASTSYKLVFSEFSAFIGAAQIILRDKFLGKTQDLKVDPEYAFSVSADAASKGDDRFEIVFVAASVLPVRYINLTAEAKGKQQAAIGWNVPEDKEVEHYQVERSANGSQFSSIGRVSSRRSSSAASYVFTDMSRLSKEGYYRIKSVLTNGEESYSSVVKLKGGASGLLVAAYPNPAKDKLQVLVQGATGEVEVKVTNAEGKQLLRRKFTTSRGNVLDINTASLSAGVYMLEIKDSNGEVTVERFVKQ